MPQHRQRHAGAIPERYAVLIDGSALFLASKLVSDSPRMNYRVLVKILCERLHGLEDPSSARGSSIWSMWTAAAPDNPGQAAFLDFTERDLHWQVRRFLPSQSFMIEPMAILGIGGETNRAGRLIRFDAAIAFAIGRLVAEDYGIVVISDSFPLAEPLARVSDNFSDRLGKPALAFFGRALDGRWYSALKQPNAPNFIDLDDFEPELFGTPKPMPQGGKTPGPVF